MLCILKYSSYFNTAFWFPKYGAYFVWLWKIILYPFETLNSCVMILHRNQKYQTIDGFIKTIQKYFWQWIITHTWKWFFSPFIFEIFLQNKNVMLTKLSYLQIHYLKITLDSIIFAQKWFKICYNIFMKKNFILQVIFFT